MTGKPLPIRLREAEQELVDSVNAIMREKELPCYLIEPYVDKLHRMISRSAQAEYEQAMLQLAASPTKEEQAQTPEVTE